MGIPNLSTAFKKQRERKKPKAREGDRITVNKLPGVLPEAYAGRRVGDEWKLVPHAGDQD